MGIPQHRVGAAVSAVEAEAVNVHSQVVQADPFLFTAEDMHVGRELHGTVGGACGEGIVVPGRYEEAAIGAGGKLPLQQGNGLRGDGGAVKQVSADEADSHLLLTDIQHEGGQVPPQFRAAAFRLRGGTQGKGGVQVKVSAM